MDILTVNGLTKTYPSFTLDNLSFRVQKGRIMGLIGRNGAGKTTTLKAILHMLQPTAGSVCCFGLDMAHHEQEIKPRIGFAGGAVDYYKKKPLSRILEVAKIFYPNWDDDLCRAYAQRFALDLRKTPSELSEGMRVKFNLLLALSHKAELLILDEPTSGLDPVSREELLDILRQLKAQGVTVLFSTHITSDLEKCADDITYIKGGRLVYTGGIGDFMAKNGGASLEDIMVAHEKEDWNEIFADQRV